MPAPKKLHENYKRIDMVVNPSEQKKFKMSEEIIRQAYEKHGLKLENYEYYHIGATTISTLKKYKIIPNKNYKEYEKSKPDALLVNRKDKSKISVVAVIEYKSPDEFNTVKQKKKATEQCNNYAQILKAKIGIITDKSEFIWINPNQKNNVNKYEDKKSKIYRTYSIIKNEKNVNVTKKFNIDQKTDQLEIAALNVNTRNSIEYIKLICSLISKTNSQLKQEPLKDPTDLAKQIWQDIWSVTGRDPEKCLYTFVELFIFKYLSDLDILDKDEHGHPVNFRNIIKLNDSEAFGNYMNTVRPHLESMFEPSTDDKTTIINGSVLNTSVAQHKLVFYKILKKFDKFGELKNIDPKFKSKIFEEFMKQNNNTKNWGRYFTPRNVIDAMIEMSDIDKLEEGSNICDPACGVGGFILEPIKVKNDTNFYYSVTNSKIMSRLNFYGFDKGFEKDEQLTIVLAKANMLIFLSELLKTNRELIPEFSHLFNKTFKLTNDIIGTLEKIESDKYDLILTNPPYVTSGSSNYKDVIKNDSTLKDFYKINGMGVESLFLEWIIRSLKPSKKAFVVVPDGILNRLNGSKLRQFIKDQCYIDGIISLPINTFYTTPKKTYILAITKKSEKTDDGRKKNIQKEPVFTYLVSNTGETLDINRFKTDKNDLKEMVCLFKQFMVIKDSFITNNPRFKKFSIDVFDATKFWSVDRWWSKEEKLELGIEDEEIVLNLEEFIQKSIDIENIIHELNIELKGIQ